MGNPAYPILLDITGRLCVIVGGGGVAVRKAKGLLAAGAGRVRMIAPVFADDAPTDVEKIAERYKAEHLADAGLVFAATDVAEVNTAVVRDAHARGIWVSRADHDDLDSGDFVVPAQFNKGPVTVAVSAGSAALAVMIRNQLAEHWDERWTALAEAMTTMRRELKEKLDEPTRRRVFLLLASEEAMNVVAGGGVDALRQWVYGQVDQKGKAP